MANLKEVEGNTKQMAEADILFRNASMNVRPTKRDIIEKAESDPIFLAEFKKDPKGAIQQAFPQSNGDTIPSNVNLVVLEDSANTIYFNIETKYPNGSRENGY